MRDCGLNPHGYVKNIEKLIASSPLVTFETLSYGQTFYELTLLLASVYVLLLTLNKTKKHNFVHKNIENKTFRYHYEQKSMKN